jgi:uncharacterized protein YegL
LVAILLTAFVATAVFSVDGARIYLTVTELKIATDAAAKAAVTSMALTQNLTTARQAAKNIAQANLVDHQPLILQDADIVFGSASLQSNGTVLFTPNATPYSAAQVTATKSEAGGPLQLLFGTLLGTSSVNPQSVSVAARETRDIVLLFDQSGSMTGQKETDLRTAVQSFVTTLSGMNTNDEVGMVTFDSSSYEKDTIGTSLAKIGSDASTLNPSSPWALTYIGGAITSAQNILQNEGRTTQFTQKVIILMSDGCQTTGTTTPLQAAQNAANASIIIYTIAYGSDADTATMQSIATTTKGTYYNAPTGASLTSAFQSIAQSFHSVLTQ